MKTSEFLVFPGFYGSVLVAVFLGAHYLLKKTWSRSFLAYSLINWFLRTDFKEANAACVA